MERALVAVKLLLITPFELIPFEVTITNVFGLNITDGASGAGKGEVGSTDVVGALCLLGDGDLLGEELAEEHLEVGAVAHLGLPTCL